MKEGKSEVKRDFQLIGHNRTLVLTKPSITVNIAYSIKNRASQIKPGFDHLVLESKYMVKIFLSDGRPYLGISLIVNVLPGHSKILPS